MRPQLSGAEWKLCCAKPAEIRTKCGEVTTREQALRLLPVAGGECLDAVVAAVETHAPEDLAAAYLIRAERNDDPVDLLRASVTAKGFNRALVLERLGLRTEAVAAWDEVYRTERGRWREEARAWRDAKRADPGQQWSEELLQDALQRRDRVTVAKIARAFPVDAALFFQRSDLTDRLLANALAEAGDAYPKAIVDALERAADRDTLTRGLQAFRAAEYESAATLLEKAGNPLHLAARYERVVQRFKDGEEPLPLLDALARRTPAAYAALSFRIEVFRAPNLEFQDRYLEAHTAYEKALRVSEGDPARMVAILNRRSPNYVTIGSPEKGLRDALRAIGLIPRVPSLKESHQAYGNAAKAARALGFTDVALHYQNAAVQVILRGLVADSQEAKLNLAIAVQKRAEIHAARGDIAAAEIDLTQASELADAAETDDVAALFRMRLDEVRGDVLLATDPRTAAAAYTAAIERGEAQDSTYRAVLYFKLAEARRRLRDAVAEEHVASAFTILNKEAEKLLDDREPGDYEDLWSGYFSRFRDMQHAAIERSIAAGHIEEAFVQAEQARAFEPMHVLLQSQAPPRGFHPIRTLDDLQYHLANLPEDTAILQYLVLPDKTYAWVLTRGKIEVVHSRAHEKQIERWRTAAIAARKVSQPDRFRRTMRAVYADLFSTALEHTAGAERIVIVPDGPMHGLPLAGLERRKDEFLIAERILSMAGSASLYLYARARDAELRGDGDPSVLLVGDPLFDRRSGLPPLRYALPEVDELQRLHYPDAHVLRRGEATIPRFLDGAKQATIVHFAGHAVANAQTPWKSRLFLTPQQNDSGELTAEKLMRELALERTRLVVLGACSTAGGQPVGPEGLAPLVRPLIAANVPAVVGTLWDVNDATSKELLVSLHCHYRNGADVATALRAAQLQMLRNNPNPMTWAAFQVVGYAGSPYRRPHVTQEETPNDGVCAQNSLQRPDGLHSQ